MSLALMMALPNAAYGPSVARWQPLIAVASERFGVPMDWIRRVMRIESGGQTMMDGRPIRSQAGAMGLMQIMPATWTALSRRHGLGNDPDEPHANILAGAAYLREMHDRFGYPGLFAAYNAGPSRYARYLAGKASLPGETTSYLRTVAPGAPLKSSENEDVKQAIFIASARLSPELASASRGKDQLFLIRRADGAASKRKIDGAGASD